MLFFLSTPDWPPFVKLTIHFSFIHFCSPLLPPFLSMVSREACCWWQQHPGGVWKHSRIWLNYFIFYICTKYMSVSLEKNVKLQKVSWNSSLSGQCCWKLWRVGTPLRPSPVILQEWHLSVGSHVSHRGTVFCRHILTDVLQRFVYAALRQVLFSSGDQCLSCSLADLMFICWWSITLSTARGLGLPSPLHRVCGFITKDKW